MASASYSTDPLRRPGWPRQYVLPLLLVLLLGLGYALLGSQLFHEGFCAKVMLYLGEKALLAHEGKPPRLENMGFVNPPLPHFFALLLKSPFAATGFVGGAIATSLLLVVLRQYRTGRISLPLLLVLCGYITVSPLSLFLFSQQMPTALLIALLLLIYYHLFMYCRHDVSYNLFLFGLLSAMVFLTEFQAILLIPLFTFSLVSRVIALRPLRSMGVLMTGLFPVVFISLAWCYLNWIFLGDPFHFISYWRSALEPLLSFPENMEQTRTLGGAFFAGLRLCRQNLPLLLPYLLLFPWLLCKDGALGCSVTGAILLAPPLLLYIQLATNFVVLNQFFLLIFVATAVAVRILRHDHCKGALFSRAFTLAMLISFGASCLPPQPQQQAEEHLFSRLLLGRPSPGNLAHYRQLLAQLEPDGLILLDDTVNYPLVYLVNDPKRFILPYEYEFDTALSAPHLFARYLVASELASTDMVQGRYPLAPLGLVPGFTLRGRFGDLVLYEVTQRPQTLPLLRLGAQREKTGGCSDEHQLRIAVHDADAASRR
ncbi:MAG: hypothetical protein BWK76_19180 [Desulfobulbaceae bacterium A2]|nr:MAG: hypothetical protein BWK76_19180 [Desulfobulbaceae bacterium A2]